MKQCGWCALLGIVVFLCVLDLFLTHPKQFENTEVPAVSVDHEICDVKSKSNSPIYIDLSSQTMSADGKTADFVFTLRSDVTGDARFRMDLPKNVTVLAGSASYDGILKRGEVMEMAVSLRLSGAVVKASYAVLELRVADLAKFVDVVAVQFGSEQLESAMVEASRTQADIDDNITRVSALRVTNTQGGDITGTLQYEDRTYDRNGFTGTEFKPIRFAKVLFQVAGETVGTTQTDLQGQYTVSLNVTGEQNLEVIAYAQSPAAAPNGVITVIDHSSVVYKAIATVNSFNTTVGGTIDFDVLIADEGAAANAFNILDCCNWGNQHLFKIYGQFIDDALTVRWQKDTASSTSYNTDIFRISLTGSTTDDDSYDDDIILHEFGHYVATSLGVDDNQGGSHSVVSGNQDIRLAWSEGLAHFHSAVIRALRDDSASSDSADQVDVRFSTTFFNIEDFDSSNGTLSAASIEIDAELSVAVALWDIFDAPTNDDDGFDTFIDELGAGLQGGANGLNDYEDFIWDTEFYKIPSESLTFPVQVSLENFFWQYYLNQSSYYNSGVRLQTLFANQGMDYREDDAEPDNTIGQAPQILTNGSLYYRTFFDEASIDPTATRDVLAFSATQDASFDIITFSLTNNCDVRIFISPDATESNAVAANNDESSNKVSATLSWTNEGDTGIYYLVALREQSTEVSSSRHQPRSRLGAYKVSVSQTGGPEAPDVNLNVNRSIGTAPLNVLFSGSADFSVGVNGVWYDYDFDGNGVWDYSSSVSGVVNHSYVNAGTWQARFRAIDSNGQSSVKTAVITVTEPTNTAILRIGTTVPDQMMQGVGQVSIAATLQNLAAGMVVESYEFDFDSDGTIDHAKYTTHQNYSVTYDYPQIDDSNIGAQQEFEATIYANLLTSAGEPIRLMATSDLITVLANPDTPDILSFNTDSLNGFAPMTAQFTQTLSAVEGHSIVLQLDTDGDTAADVYQASFTAGADATELIYNHDFQQARVYEPVLFALDQTNGLITRKSLDNNPGHQVIVFQSTQVGALRCAFVGLEAGDYVAGLLPLQVQVYAGDDLIDADLSNVKFQYRQTGTPTFSNMNTTVHRQNDILSTVFDTSQLNAAFDYDVALLIDNDSSLRDSTQLAAVQLSGAPAGPAQLNQLGADVEQIGFRDTAGRENLFFEIDATQSRQLYSGNGDAVLLPADFSATQVVTVQMHRLGDNELGGQMPADFTHAEVGLEVTVVAGALNNPGADVTLLKPLTLQIAYPDENNDGLVDTIGLSEYRLALYYFDTSSSSWKPESLVTIDPVANVLTVTVSHLTSFALFASEDDTPIAGGGGGGGGCFIATAAYGSYAEKHVMLLREFRDKCLLTNAPGTWFVENYYHYSPPIADYIAERPPMKATTRVALIPLIAVSWFLVKASLLSQTIILLTMALALRKAIAMWQHKRHKTSLALQVPMLL